MLLLNLFQNILSFVTTVSGSLPSSFLKIAGANICGFDHFLFSIFQPFFVIDFYCPEFSMGGGNHFFSIIYTSFSFTDTL
jgi:hypothetical protein